MDITFELLTRKDFHETYDLCQRVFGDSPVVEKVWDVFMSCVDDKHYRMIVGKVDGKIVAYTTMILFHNVFDGPYPVATLWYVCVDEAYRRKGIATALFKEIECIARQEKCEIIYFTSLKDNVGAHAFYKAAGYDDAAEKAFVKYLYKEWSADDY